MKGTPGAGHELELLSASHSVCRLDPAAEAPEWARAEDGAVLSIARTADELSVICADHLPPPGVDRSRGWRAIRLAGTLDHSLIGVLSTLLEPLAAAEIPIFAISTFDTDYLLVPGRDLEAAREALERAGHRFGDR